MNAQPPPTPLESVAFDPNGFPLEPGVQLLEASAGTGKTFALAHLVLRLVTRPHDPLPLEQLLVVTFTEAAAAELRDRIALRLQQALSVLAPPQAGAHQAANDAVLLAWREAQPEEPETQLRLRGLLLLALEALDRADITTIHGFARRTLQRQALEAGLGPALELDSDDGERAAQVIHDYWQQQLLVLPPPLLAGLQGQGLTPELLERLLVRLDGDPSLELDPLPEGVSANLPLAGQLPQWLERRWHGFRSAWAERGAALEAAFCAAAADLRSRGASATKPYAPKPRRQRVAELDDWIAGFERAEAIPGYGEVVGQELLSDYFHPAPFTRVAADVDGERVSLPERPLLEAIAALVDGPIELVLAHALHHGRGELARRRAAAGRIGFADLLSALDPGPTGAGQQALLDAVGERYRVALIDEFQDTDPIQWRILARAFVAPQGPSARHLLVMVGDPKQAIYRFRGGELATYRLARARAEAIHGLWENRRSAAPLVAALNALMAPGLPRSGLPVPPVIARAEKGELLLEPDESPLQVLPLGDADVLPDQVAALCLGLLQRGLRLRGADPGVAELSPELSPAPAGPPAGDRGERPLNPADLCLLVGTHSQAEQLRRALEQRGLPSRLVSRGDVFASDSAAALQRLLDALAEPGHPGRQRLLATSALLGWSAERLAQAEQRDWEWLADRLAELSQRLETGGLLACLGDLLSTEGLARLSLGGRLLADLQQAAQLVQERMHQLGLGAAAAAAWLRRIRLEPQRRVPEERQLNSTAADAAIAVVTVHRSKGLEYPVVICPYLWRQASAPTSSPGEIGRRWLPPGGAAPRLDLHRSPHWGLGRQAALQDLAAQRQEDERLAYVAATRARHLLVLGWRQEGRHDANPLAAWLLDGAGWRSPDALPLVRLDPAGLPGPEGRWRPPAAQGALQGGALPRHRLDTSWGRSSYSSWTHGGANLGPNALEEGRDTRDDGAAPAVACDDDPADDALPVAGAATASDDGERQGPLASFPRGTGPGEVLHRILEQLDYGRSAQTPEALALIEQELGRAGLDPALVPPLVEGLERLRLCPCGGPLGGFRLAELPLAERLNELNFDLPLALPRSPAGAGPGAPQPDPPRVRAEALADCFHRHPGGLFGRAYAQRLAGLEIASRGFLTGSIDLVFRQGERWWVLDWKSNWLGERDPAGVPVACGPAHYGTEAMARLMAASHYPLQAHLYLVALHRYLRWRLPRYSPDQHLGGYAYAFLRGVPDPTPAVERLAAAGGAVPGLLVERPPLGRVLALDGLLRQGEP
ncbi:MAG: UvrD-helicase domain-containing protein [Cyanobacteriota bacterium]